MDYNVWPEATAELFASQLRAEARRLNLGHQPPTRWADWEPLREKLRARLDKLTGSWPPPPDPGVEVHGERRQDGYRIQNISFQTRPGMRATANLYLPDGDGPFPGILGTHGHWSQGKLAARVAARGHTFAKEGFVVLIIDAIGSGERGTLPGKYEYHGKQIGGSLLPVGETLLGMQVYDNMRAIDVLQSLPCVDAKRIGVTGASGGGNQTMWISAFDRRVKAAVPVVSVGTFESYICNPNCICECLPEGLPLTEEWGILALAAPAAVLILNAMKDSNAAFNIKEMVRSFNAARNIYQMHGKIDSFAYRCIDLPHGYWPEMRSHALGWFKLHLKGEGHGWPCAIPPIPELPEEELKCFPDDKRPDSVQSILGFARNRGVELQAERQPAEVVGKERKRRDLRTLLRLEASPVRVAAGPAVGGEDEGMSWCKFTVDGGNGSLFPCCQFLPESGEFSQVLIAVHPGGKNALADWVELRAKLAAGISVCFVDLRGIGECAWDNGRIAPGHDAARTSLWLGRTMLGEWTRDLLTLRKIFAVDGCSVSLAGWGIAALAAACAAALEPSIASLELHDLPQSLRVADAETIPDWHMAAYVPNFLKWGDVDDVLALFDGEIIR